MLILNREEHGGDDDPIVSLVEGYFELNSNAVDELDEEPSALEFMRYVASNKPFIVRSAAAHWTAVQTWTPDYLRDALRGESVNVAVTPYGNADAPTLRGEALVFAKPMEEDQSFAEFLQYVIEQEVGGPAPGDGEVRYAQTQNDNLRNEYVTLFGDVHKDIPFARIALERDPEAINLWIGNSRSVTAMHQDVYENIYVQVLGNKHFVLLPPQCQPCVNEQSLPPARYVRDGESGQLVLQMDEDEDGHPVPFPTWDPDSPGKNTTPYSRLARPLRVTLHPGDMLYLPSMWYHKVSQSARHPEGLSVSVNYWHDMDFSGPVHALSTFVGSVFKEHGSA